MMGAREDISRKRRAFLIVFGVVVLVLSLWRCRPAQVDPATAAHQEESINSPGDVSKPPEPTDQQQTESAEIPETSSVGASMNQSMDRFDHHQTLLRARLDVREARSEWASSGIPATALNQIQAWAMVLYRDSLLTVYWRIPASQPEAQTLAMALQSDVDPNLERLKQAGLGDIPEERIIRLLSSVADLAGPPDLMSAQGLLQEFEHLFKKAKQRSDSFYMSEMKSRLGGPVLPMSEKTAFVEKFVAIGDVVLAEYPREYFEEVLLAPALNPDERSKIQDLLGKISRLRSP